MITTYQPISCRPPAASAIATIAIAPPSTVPMNRSRPRRPVPPIVDCITKTAPIAAGLASVGMNRAASIMDSPMPDTAAAALAAAAGLNFLSAAPSVGARPVGLAGANPMGKASAVAAKVDGRGRSVSDARSEPPTRRA